MKLYEVEFDSYCYVAISKIPELTTINFKWVKSDDYPGYVYHSSEMSETVKEEQKNFKEAWDKLSIEEAIEKHPNKIRMSYGNTKYILTLEQYEKCFNFCKLTNIINLNIAEKMQIQAINIESLAAKIADKLGTNIGQTYNQKLEVHQPNMPLFTYNQFKVLTDCCTERLQSEYINEGWRVVAICPQPDQRRPDYIIGQYLK